MLKVIFLGNQLFDFMFVRLQRVIVDGLLRSIFFLPFSHKTQRKGAKHDANIWRKKRLDSLSGSGNDGVHWFVQGWASLDCNTINSMSWHIYECSTHKLFFIISPMVHIETVLKSRNFSSSIYWRHAWHPASEICARMGGKKIDRSGSLTITRWPRTNIKSKN